MCDLPSRQGLEAEPLIGPVLCPDMRAAPVNLLGPFAVSATRSLQTATVPTSPLPLPVAAVFRVALSIITSTRQHELGHLDDM
jgi:hypothetical protein